jgi:tetratricopeptide (TPR) repeat protein
MIDIKNKTIGIITLVGSVLGISIISFWLNNTNNSSIVNLSLHEAQQIGNTDFSLLEENKTVADSVNTEILSELKTTEDDELQQFLTQTEITSIVIDKPENTTVSHTDSAKSYYEQGLLYGIYQKHLEAIANYDRALAINPEFTLGYYHRGIAKEKLGEIATAIQDYQKAQSLAQQQKDLTALEMAQHKLDYLVK